MECEGCGTTLKAENGDQETLCLCCWMEENVKAAFPRDEWDVWIGTPEGWKAI